jgi:hypothetical protein
MYIIFKDKKSKRSHKAVGIKVFLIFLLGDRRIRIQEAQKHVDPVDPDSDPDPQHCLFHILVDIYFLILNVARTVPYSVYSFCTLKYPP